MKNVRVFEGNNPSELYLEALWALQKKGKKLAPRGKEILELRPAIFGFQNPRAQVTFVKGRMVNPFFQLAESLWILAGRSDVYWLAAYNANMASFSDDGVNFNAPYGERLRYWNRNALSGVPDFDLDQINDVIQKLQDDPETRQAVALIYNPLYDNASVDTKDRPCNVSLFFKLRDGHLDLTVNNRSNDLHWGTFGANLAQFTTILNYVAAILDVEPGVYYQITDSLHIYTEDYGAKETDKIFSAYGVNKSALTEIIPKVTQFSFNGEPKFSGSARHSLEIFFSEIDPLINDVRTYSSAKAIDDALLIMADRLDDDYIYMAVQMMMIYRAHKLGQSDFVAQILECVYDCAWKISGMRFLYKRHKDNKRFIDQVAKYTGPVQKYIIGE